MFWIKVDVQEKGDVEVTTYGLNASGFPYTERPIRKRHGTTVSQALRALAASMVYAEAETVGKAGKEATPILAPERRK